MLVRDSCKPNLLALASVRHWPTFTDMPQAKKASAAPAAQIPFTGSAHEHVEQVTFQSITPGAAAVQQGPFDVPAYGYLRHIFLEVVASGGTIGAGVAHPDYPFNIFQNVTLLDVNGAPLVNIDGYALLQCNVYGGFGFRSDPRLAPWYVSTINTAFFLRIPVEISRHNALGSLANQNAAAAYKLQWTINPSTAMFTTAPTTPPTITVRPQLEAWSLPNPADLAGRAQSQVPPAHGTTQYISYFTRTVGSGLLTYLLPRVGNLLRLLIFISRNNTAQGAGENARDDTVFPNPFQVIWDARVLTNETQNYRIARMTEALINGATRDTGVFALIFNNTNNGQVGDENPNLWIPTVQSTRLEVDGTIASGAPNNIKCVTVDIAPVEVMPQERYVEGSATGFHPRVGEPNQYAM